MKKATSPFIRWKIPFLISGFTLMLLIPACYVKEDPYVAPPASIPDTLPAFTTVGANTFGCMINGKVWVPKADWRALFDERHYWLTQTFLSEKNPALLYTTMTAFQNVDALSPDGIKRGFTFNFPGKRGLYFSVPYNNADSDSTHFRIEFFDYNNTKWYYPTDNKVDTTNQLNIIRLDTARNIVSGTFKFRLYKGANGKITKLADTLVVKEGRFDLRYFPK